jgi:excisionase family DNA binding protein
VNDDTIDATLRLPVVTVNEAATLARVSRRTIWNWLQEGKVRGVRTAGGGIRIERASLWRTRVEDAPVAPAPDTWDRLCALTAQHDAAWANATQDFPMACGCEYENPCVAGDPDVRWLMREVARLRTRWAKAREVVGRPSRPPEWTNPLADQLVALEKEP